MSIKINLDLVLLKKGISSKDLAMTIGITSANLSILKARAIRFSTLNDICKALDCQPGDILEYIDDDTDGVDINLENNID